MSNLVQLTTCIALLSFVTSDVGATPSVYPNTELEADRLNELREILKQGKTPKLQPLASGLGNYCEVLLSDLLDSSKMTAVEPKLVLNSEYPLPEVEFTTEPNLNNENLLEKSLGSPLLQSINRCTQSEGEGNFKGFQSLVGSPPFRIYMLPSKVNPFPSAELIYWSEYIEKADAGRKGYLWVDLAACTHVGGTSSLTDAARLRQDPNGQKSSLVIYRGNVVSLDIARDFIFSAHTLHRTRKKIKDIPNTCSWTIY